MKQQKKRQRFLEPFKKIKRSVAIMTGYALVESLLAVGIIYGIQYAVEAIEVQNNELFLQWILGLAGIALLTFIIKIIIKPYLFIYFRDANYIMNVISLPKLIHGDSTTYEKIGTGKLMSIYNTGTHSWMLVGMELFSHFASSLLFFCAFLWTIYAKEPLLFVISCGAIFLVVIWLYFTSNWSYALRKKAKEVGIERTRLSTKWFMSKYEILQNDKIQTELEKDKELNNKRFGFAKKEKTYQGLSYDGGIFFITLLVVGLIYYTGKQVSLGLLSYGDLIVIVGLGTAFMRDLGQISYRIRSGIIDNWVHIEKLRDMLDDLHNNTKKQGEKTFLYQKGQIELTNVTYGYNDDNYILADFSLSISPHAKVALVGPSGSGKSTIIKLIAGYLTPTKGKVMIDKQNLQDVTVSSYYNHIGYLTQEPSIFDGTVRENLLYGVGKQEIESDDDNERTDENLSLHDAIEKSQCQFIYDLPKGIDTEIGERGVLLSGGQRQRLAIAKIFLKNPEIILLDEPTSALDSVSEEAIGKALHNLFDGRTVVIIAHRLQTVRSCDEILVIDDGQIVECGTHESLISANGSYAKMLELQSGF